MVWRNLHGIRAVYDLPSRDNQGAGRMKAKLYALLASIGAIALVIFGKKKEAQGKEEQKAKTNEVILDNVRKSTKASQSVLDPVKRDKLRKEATRD